MLAWWLAEAARAQTRRLPPAARRQQLDRDDVWSARFVDEQLLHAGSGALEAVDAAR